MLSQQELARTDLVETPARFSPPLTAERMNAEIPLRKIPIDVFTVQDADQGDFIGIDDQAHAIVPQPEAVMAAFR